MSLELKRPDKTNIILGMFSYPHGVRIDHNIMLLMALISVRIYDISGFKNEQ